jgi:two-component system, NtrC family, sensor histidine kinase HydH
MLTKNPQIRYLRPLALISLLLLGLCAIAATLLWQQQDSTNKALHDNLNKRRAVADLLENSKDVSVLLRDGVDKVEHVHDRIYGHLKEVQAYAAKFADPSKVKNLLASFDNYFALWKQIHQPGYDQAAGFEEAADVLDLEIVPLCRELVDSSTKELEHSEEDIHRSMRWLAWGMGGVGLMEVVAGLVFGYGVARSFSRTIRHLQFRLQVAAGKIGPDLPEIVVSGEGDVNRLEGQMQELMNRVEQLVGKLQQREREVLRAEQLAAVGQLAAGVAHEIRNPLTSIKMLVQAGREEQGGLADDDLEVIEREALRMERSLKVFLDFARLPKPERSEQDMAAIANRTLDLIRGRAAKQHVELKLLRPDGPVRVEADGEQIRQVLVNLSLNALDVMPAGGTLEMVVKPLPHEVEVSVLDTGPGIASELMPRLFEPFVSTKETGLGLGLVISRRIIEEHHGRLRAANRGDGGACFTFNLPIGTDQPIN